MKNLRILFVLIIWGFVFNIITAQTMDPDKQIPPDPNIKIGRLDNGLTYYIKQNKKPEQRMEIAACNKCRFYM